ncbi:hypothetical protein PUN28_007246 [Cardiocondyla obscurior]|uniref:Uncharacterized protein n=1 Tax=Cardiocondyla obscurior TaxID=286306 RepID=A0AAW2G4E1_9HYME
MIRRRPPARSIAPLCAIAWAFWIALPAQTDAGSSYADNKQRYDGFYNNLIHPDWGAIGKYLNLVLKIKYLCCFIITHITELSFYIIPFYQKNNYPFTQRIY